MDILSTVLCFIRVFCQGVCSIRVIQQSSVYKSMSLIYPNKFTYLNTVVIQLAQRCLDNRGQTVPGKMPSIIVSGIPVNYICTCTIDVCQTVLQLVLSDSVNSAIYRDSKSQSR